MKQKLLSLRAIKTKYQKIDNITEILIRMVSEYKVKVQSRSDLRNGQREN
jgi:hypothetical protein